MIKICVFVEGAGELVFLHALFSFMFRDRNATIKRMTMNGGKRFPRLSMNESEIILGSGLDFYVQIVNSATEGRVVSDALDRKETLVAAGFDQILIVRDVAPNFKRSEVSRLRKAIESELSGIAIPTALVLEVMEFESWLLSMADYFVAVDERMSDEAIRAALGFLPDCKTCQALDRPSDEFRTIVGLAEINEPKSAQTVEMIVSAFDFGELVANRASHIKDLNGLIATVRSYT